MFNVADKFKDDLRRSREARGGGSLHETPSRFHRPKLRMSLGIGALVTVAAIFLVRSPGRLEELKGRLRKAA